MKDKTSFQVTRDAGPSITTLNPPNKMGKTSSRRRRPSPCAFKLSGPTSPARFLFKKYKLGFGFAGGFSRADGTVVLVDEVSVICDPEKGAEVTTASLKSRLES
ncbi:MAG TPA: hypothetical protein VMG63_04175 [Terriglobia bacterium]|nr:hypothetical protein [Terriglobia bacterium]